MGQMIAITTSEPGILQRDWLRQYGDERGVMRAIGPLGIERMIFFSNQALQKILVTDWMDYPRVCHLIVIDSWPA